MSEKKNQIDQFYSDALENYSQSASGYAWMRMRWRLLWISYSRYLAGIGVIIIIGAAFYFGTVSSGDEAVSPNTEEPASIQQTVETSSVTVPEIKSANDIDNIYVQEETPTSIEASPSIQHTNKQFDQGIMTENLSQKDMTNHVEILMMNEDPDREPPLERNIQIATMTGITDEPFQLNSDDKSLSESAAIQQEIAIPYDIPLKKTWFTLGFYFAPAYNFYRLSSENEVYNNYRKDHETPSVSWSAGADIRINIRNWYIQTGLTYSTYKLDRNYNHTFEALDSLQSFYQTDTIWGWVFDPPEINKPIVLGYDTTFVPVYNDINEGTNEWHYLEIPLLAGYKFNTGRFSFDIGTGFSYGFLLYRSGNVPDLEQENVFVELENIEMNSHMFNYLLQFGISYHLTPEWSLNISPWYKHNLNSVFDNNYPVDQRLNTIGINFGLRVDL
jgi:hypothetical protein